MEDDPMPGITDLVMCRTACGLATGARYGEIASALACPLLSEVKMLVTSMPACLRSETRAAHGKTNLVRVTSQRE
jgi:hypothetical protein